MLSRTSFNQLILLVLFALVATLAGCAPAPGPDERAEDTEVREEMQRTDADHPAAPGQKLDRVQVTGSRVAPAMMREAADPMAHLRAPDRPVNRENYHHFDDNPIRWTRP